LRVYQEPRTWHTFRDMYEEVRDCQVGDEEGLLALLEKALKEKVQTMDRAELRTRIQGHIDAMKDKLARRDFTKLYSARLTYQEVQALEQFLEMRPRRGYAMDIGRYVSGG